MRTEFPEEYAELHEEMSIAGLLKFDLSSLILEIGNAYNGGIWTAYVKIQEQSI